MGEGVQGESNGELAGYAGKRFGFQAILLGDGTLEIDHAMSEEFFRLRYGFFYFHYIEYDKRGGVYFAKEMWATYGDTII